MANEFKVTFFFNSGISGWSESYYNGGGSYESVADKARNLAIQRMVLCGTGVDLTDIRVSRVDVRGDAYFDPKPGLTTRATSPLGGMTRITPAEESPADVSWTALLVNIVENKITRGRIYMRGLPDLFFTSARSFIPDKDWKTAFLAYAGVFHDAVNDWGIIRKLPSSPLNTFNIKSAAAVFGQNLKLTMKAGFAAAAGNIVAVRGLKSDLGTLSGNFEVVDWTAPVLEIEKSFPGLQPLFRLNSGTVQVAATSFLRELDIYRRTGTERKAGRPFGAPVGRRRRANQLR